MKALHYIFLLAIVTACSYEDEQHLDEYSRTAFEHSIEMVDSINQLRLVEFLVKNRADRYPEIKYHLIKIEDWAHREQLMKEFRDTKENFAKNKTFITLNRKERGYMRVGDFVVVPDTSFSDMRNYSVFPPYYHGARDISKLIMVSNLYQSYACYEYGELVRFAAANTGKERTQTYPGRYSLVWKSKLRISSLNSDWKLPFTWNFHRFAGSAFHQFAMPGYPASHSCVRQFLDDAEWLYHWGKQAKYEDKTFVPNSGTPVVIVDAFDFSLNKDEYPWLHLSSNKEFPVELPENPLEVEEAYIPISQVPEEIRGMLPNKQRYVYAEDTLRKRGVIRKNVTITPSVNFNKLKKEKAIAKKKKEAEKQSQKQKTDLELIKENLNELEGSEPR